MELIEIEESRHLTREEAAAFLREIADSLARHNSIDFKRGGMKFNLKVANEVELEFEVEIGDDGSKIEIEISW